METEIDPNDPMMALLNNYIEKRVLESCNEVAEHLFSTFDARTKPLEEEIAFLRDELEKRRQDDLDLDEELSTHEFSDEEGEEDDSKVSTFDEVEESIENKIRFDKWGSSFVSKMPAKVPLKKAPSKVPLKASAKAAQNKASTSTSQKRIPAKPRGGKAQRGRPRGRENDTISKGDLANENLKLRKLLEEATRKK